MLDFFLPRAHAMPGESSVDLNRPAPTSGSGDAPAIVAAWCALVGATSLTAGLYALDVISDNTFVVSLVLIAWFVLEVSRWVRREIERREFSLVAAWGGALLVVGSTVGAGALVAMMTAAHPWPVMIVGGSVMATSIVAFALIGRQLQQRQAAETPSPPPLVEATAEPESPINPPSAG